MPEHPLNVIRTLDPTLFEHVNQESGTAFADGALPRKFKLLVALALDAAQGAVDGVRALSRMALAAGATREEVAETLRVTLHISGAGAIYTAAAGLKEDL